MTENVTVCECDTLAKVIDERLDRIEQKVDALGAFAQQLATGMEQFQQGGMGRMIMGMIGGKNAK